MLKMMKRRSFPTDRSKFHRPLRLEPLEGRTLPTTFVVIDLGDTGVGPAAARGDLRYCLERANATAGEDLIIFEAQGTINLVAPLPAVTDDLILAGPGADRLTV